jgi:AraC-like DNA-binding protein
MNPQHCTTWAFEATDDEVATIYPDGCVDVVFRTSRSGEMTVVASPLDRAPRSVTVNAGESFRGVRLRPGLLLDEAALALATPERVMDEFWAFVRMDTDLAHAVDELATGVAPSAVAVRAGVSLRTLQRQFRQHGLAGPDFWRLLGRARSTARELLVPSSLVEVALECGYADQAHMTRELVRWFGMTPRQLLRSPDRLELLTQPALGNWTREQISTR